MSVTRLVLRGVAIAPGEMVVPPAAAKHARVARVGAGERIELLDLQGTVGIGRLLAWQRASCRIQIERVERERGEPPESLVLAVGVLHTAAFDWLVEKATELGATSIVPVIAERVQGRRHETRVARWRRIAEAAVAQCGRTRAPAVAEPMPLPAFLAGAQGLRLIADPDAAAQPAAPSGGGGITVLVGPEGGFTPAEVEAARRCGFGGISLGPRTLRAETAALAALVIAQRLGARGDG